MMFAICVKIALLSWRPFLEDLIALWDRDPRLLASCPDVPRRPHPGRVVERACPDPDQAIPGRAGNPRPALRANPPGAGPAAIGEALKRTRFDTAEPEPV